MLAEVLTGFEQLNFLDVAGMYCIIHGYCILLVLEIAATCFFLFFLAGEGDALKQDSRFIALQVLFGHCDFLWVVFLAGCFVSPLFLAYVCLVDKRSVVVVLVVVTIQ